MWPFTRKADAPKADGEPAPGLPQIRFDWKAVAPIQRVIGDHPLTIPTEPFAQELTTHQDPRAIAEPLGHQLSLAAPRGLVLGIAQPGTRADGPEMLTRPRPSRATQVQRDSEESAEATAPIDTPDIEAPLMTGGAPVGSTTRHLPTSGATPLQRTLLTAVGPENEPTPLPPTRDIVLAGSEPAAEPEGVEAAASLPALPRLTLGQARRMGLGAPINRVPDSSVQRAPDRGAPPPVAGPAPPPTPVAEELPYDPIFPLDFPTPKPVVAPAPISRPQRIPAALPLARSAVSASPPDAAETANTAPNSAVEPQSVAPLLGPPVVATAGDPRHTMLAEPATGEQGGIEAAWPPLPLAGAPLPTQRTEVSDERAEEAPSPTLPGSGSEITGFAPLLAGRPLVGSTVQRAPESAASATGGAPADPMPVGLSGIRVYRGATAATTASAIGARAYTDRGDIYLPAAHGPLNDMPARSLLAHELVHVSQQRRVGGALPGEHSEEGRLMEAEAATVERSAATDTELPLARIAAPGVQAAPSVQAAASAQGPRSAQASTVVIEARAPWATSDTMQRAPERGASPAVSEAPSDISSGQPAAAASPAATNDDETHIDELASKLYDKIRSRLRNELLVDRERAGFLTDLR